MRLEVATAVMPKRDRLGAWEALLHDLPGMQPDRMPDASTFRAPGTFRAPAPFARPARFAPAVRWHNLSVAADGHRVRRSTGDIAFAWGFGTPSTFYRAFQAAFGLSPGDLRARQLR